MRETSSTITVVPKADPTPVVHVAIASYMADHRLDFNSLEAPRTSHPRFAITIRDVDVESWLREGVRFGKQEVREVSVDPGWVIVVTDAEIDTALGTVALDLRWIEAKTLTRRLQAVQP